jgi:hypothetical protein
MITVGAFNTPLSSISKSFLAKKSTNSESNCTIDQMNLTDIYRIFHSTTAKYTFPSAARVTFSK